MHTGRSKREGTGTVDAAGGAGDECGFSREVWHDRSLSCFLDSDTHGAQGSAAERNIDTSRTNSSGYWWWEPCAEFRVNDQLCVQQVLLQDE